MPQEKAKKLSVDAKEFIENQIELAISSMTGDKN
jgi:hypothetical protein